MPIRRLVEKGGEYLIPFAMKKLARLKVQSIKSNQKSLSQTVYSDRGATVKITTTNGIDTIRITVLGKVYNVFVCQIVDGKIIWWATEDFDKWKRVSALDGYGPPISIIGTNIFSFTKQNPIFIENIYEIARIKNKSVREVWEGTFFLPPPGSPAFPTYNVIAGLYPDLTITAPNGIVHEVTLTSEIENEKLMGSIIRDNLADFTYISRQWLYFVTQVDDISLLGFKFYEQNNEAYEPVMHRYLFSTKEWLPLVGSPPLVNNYRDDATSRDIVIAHDEWSRSLNLQFLAFNRGPYAFFNYKGKLAFWALVKDDDYKEFGGPSDNDVYRRWYRLHVSMDSGVTWSSEMLYYFETTHYIEHVASPIAESEPGIVIPFLLTEIPVGPSEGWNFGGGGRGTFQFAIFHDTEDSNNDAGVFGINSSFSGQVQIELYRWGESAPFKKLYKHEIYATAGYDWPPLTVTEQFVNFYSRMFRNDEDLMFQFLSLIWVYTSEAQIDTEFLAVYKYYKSKDQGATFEEVLLPEKITENGNPLLMLSAQHACGMHIHNDLRKWGG